MGGGTASQLLRRIRSGRDSSSSSSSAQQGAPVGKGCWVSEAALWTQWVHCGELESLKHCLLVAICGEGFTRVMTLYNSAARQLAAYATAFVDELNHGDSPSDLHNRTTML